MSKVNGFNEGQQEAIFKRNQHILVSAPAGSGKTKILVSRILELLKEGVNIDQFLVLTFTAAAASEMKQRLVKMLDEQIQEVDDDALKKHLLVQKEKMPFSYITNFHGFCNQLISMYGYLVGIEPGYEILSDNKDLLNQCIEQIIDEALNDSSFNYLVGIYFNKPNELKEVFLKFYTMMQSNANRDEFVRKMKEDVYDFMTLKKDQDLANWIFYPYIKYRLKESCIIGLNKLTDLKGFCREFGITPFYERPISQGKGPASKAIPYEAYRKYYLDVLKALDSDCSFGEVVICMKQEVEKSYLIPWKDLDDLAKSKQKEYGTLKTNAMKCLDERYKLLVDTDRDNLAAIFNESKLIILSLIDENGWIWKLEKLFQEKKRELNVLDFNDLEHYATMLLQDTFPVSKALHDKLYEIMIDEYQDSATCKWIA